MPSMFQVDSNACKMVYEDNEDEYDDFYEYSALDGEDDAEGGVRARGLQHRCGQMERQMAPYAEHQQCRNCSA